MEKQRLEDGCIIPSSFILFHNGGKFMEKEELLNALKKVHNGSYINIIYRSTLIPNRDNKDKKIEKIVSAVVRLGVAYSHINAESVVASRKYDENGKLIPEKLPWGQWDPDCCYLINHTKEDKKTKELKTTSYLRCTVSRSPNHHSNIKYLLNGKEVSKEEIMPLTIGSEWTERKDELVVFVKPIEQVLSLGKGGK